MAKKGISISSKWPLLGPARFLPAEAVDIIGPRQNKESNNNNLRRLQYLFTLNTLYIIQGRKDCDTNTFQPNYVKNQTSVNSALKGEWLENLFEKLRIIETIKKSKKRLQKDNINNNKYCDQKLIKLEKIIYHPFHTQGNC